MDELTTILTRTEDCPRYSKQVNCAPHIVSVHSSSLTTRPCCQGRTEICTVERGLASETCLTGGTFPSKPRLANDVII